MRIDLWDGTIPHSLGSGDEAVPHLDVYLPEPDRATGSAMLILPGGCYTFLSEKSGVQYGQWLASEGIVGAVVNFRLGSAGYRYPALLADAWQALAVVRSRAHEWGVDSDRVGVVGSSAGAHLATMMLTGEPADGNAAPRPAVGVLCYPVVSMQDPLAHEETRDNFLGDRAADEELQARFSAELRIDGQVPPCFIWHSLEDKEVNPANSIDFARGLHAAGRSYELHLYQTGPHAIGLARAEGLQWTADCARWLHDQEF